ncbi:hypothetical protein PKB_5523 [Pseudomonas knackmussii B13]|uniref:Secreted protein n=1 Tax=Pseudomonas knackmussii (strain DSM 6978 / CCUG 54928 / LMG 23759 / B13) TaxID=1301098 RepID=A0A024HQN3_PSEKB|nr:hypothetical protein [Pseudomonas knackmussii]CDF86833.1 hypothetical protein PKB_5523 [Pseudomonas knackmussii B13]
MKRLLPLLLALPLMAQAQSAIERQQEELHLLRQGWFQQTPPDAGHAASRPGGMRDSGQDGVGLLLHDVDMYFEGGIGFHSPELKGWLVPLKTGEPVDFDRPQDMRIEVSEGEVILNPQQLANLFNQRILAYPQSMLRNFSMSLDGDRLLVSGEVQPLGIGPWLPLRLSGGVKLEGDEILYQPDQVKVLGVPAYGAMSLVGLHLDSLVRLERPGALLRDNAMRLNYHQVFPLVGIDGHVDAAWLDDKGLHLRFARPAGSPAPRFEPPTQAGPSYVWLQSGDLKIFEILITYSQVLLKAEQPGQTLVFNLKDYRKVLSTGITQVNEDGTFFMRVPPYSNDTTSARLVSSAAVGSP